MLSSLFVLGMMCFGLSGCGSTEQPEQGWSSPGLPGGGESISMDPPEDPDPVLSSWVPPTPDGEEQEENSRLYTPRMLRAGDAGNENDVLLHWSVESANQQAFLIERQQWWGEVWTNDELIVAPPYPYTYRDNPGAGLWRYRIAAANEDGASDPTDWAEVSVASSWTTFTPSADTRIVYVSSSEGNDSNDGLSPYSPKATIAAGYALLRHGYPDWLLLKRGDVWDATFGVWTKSGRSADEKMLIGSYGNGVARPLIRSGSSNGFTRQQGGSPYEVSYLALVGIHLWAHTRTSADGGTGILLLDGGEHWLIEDCKVEGYSNNVTIQNFRGTFRNIHMHRCVIVDAFSSVAHSQGLFVSGVEDFALTECILDHNGYRDGVTEPTIYSHNVYIQSNTPPVLLRDNLSARSASHGAQVRGGGTVTGCLFIRNAIGLLAGGGDPVAEGGVPIDVRDNIVLEGTDIRPDLPRGFGIDFKNVSSGAITNNIVANKLSTYGAFGIGSWVSGGPPGIGIHNLTISGNTVYNWRGGLRVNNQSPAEYVNVHFTGNLVQSLLANDTKPLVESQTTLTGITFSHNRYYSAAANTPFYHTSTAMNFSTWQAAANDVGSTIRETHFVDPSRDLARYYSMLIGETATVESALDALRSQSRHSWDDRLRISTIREYIAAGFERTD